MSEALEKLVHSSAPEGTRSRARRHLCRAPVTRGSPGSALRPKSRRPYAREGAGGSWIPLAGPHREVAGTCRGLHGGRRARVHCGPLPPPGLRPSGSAASAGLLRPLRGRGGEWGTHRPAGPLNAGRRVRRKLTPPPPSARAHEGEKDTHETETGTETDGWHR